MQKRIIRAMCGVGRMQSSAPLFKSMGLLNLGEINFYMTDAYIQRTLLDGQSDVFERRVSVRNLRSDIDRLLRVPFVTVEMARQGIAYRGPMVYNSKSNGY